MVLFVYFEMVYMHSLNRINRILIDGKVTT
jgi:hypothetical protein